MMNNPGCSPTHPPLWLTWLLQQTLSTADFDVAFGDLAEGYRHCAAHHGQHRANLWLLQDILHDIPAMLGRHFYWRLIMLKNYFKVAFRNIKRQRLYAAINILGLAIGMAGCLLIFLWVQDERSYDRYHSKASQIFRVEREMHFRDLHGQVPITAGTYGEALVMDYPEIEDFCRIDALNLTLRDHRQVFREQEAIAADATLFTLFDFELEKGDKEEALIAPQTVVLTREAAQRYLGTEDALGKTLPIQWGGELYDFQVTGIMEPVRDNSHFTFDMAISIENYGPMRLGHWAANFLYTYVQLSESAEVAVLEAGMGDFVMKHLAAPYAPYLPEGTNPLDVTKIRMKPMTDIHLHPSEQWEIAPQGSQSSVVIFSAIALLILIIACINFINLSTARAAKRALEVGLRKTVGAHTAALRAQFISESVFLAATAALIAVAGMAAALPAFNALAAKSISIWSLFKGGNILIFMSIIVITGIFSGLYPAFYLSSFDPVKVLKGEMRKGKKRQAFRRSMTVMQFVISITLIVSTLVVMRQMEFIQHKELGFDRENVLIVNPMRNIDQARYQPFYNAMVQDSRIINADYSTNRPGEAIYSDTVFRIEGKDDNFLSHQWEVGYDFIDVMKMTMVAGRNFNRAMATDSSSAVVNEAAARAFGFSPEEAIGKHIVRPTGTDQDIDLIIVGVVEDFHFKTLHLDVEPATMILRPEFGGRLAIRLSPGQVMQAVNFVQSTWEQHFPEEPFQYYFLDDSLMSRYAREMQMRNLFLVFAGLSIAVACLGLFGLASYTAEEKTKEIGIRKVMGASIPNIILNLLKEFTRWVLMANVVAWPLAWLLMQRWLEDFAVRINLSIDLFLIAALTALIIALLTVAAQAIKASLANPVKSLKYQ